jgi:Fe-Mn family superoxide dismutase
MPFQLPDLPYAFDSLEPHVDEQTMRIHHGKHHQAYTDNLNKALEGTEFEGRDIEALLANLDALPDEKRMAVRNNGGGFLNHSIFWPAMSPDGGGEPAGELGDAILAKWGSFDAFKESFAKAATGQFGSGWAWLELTPAGALDINGYANQDNPVMQGSFPVLGLDVWEHAYYLKYQNRRPEYVGAWWNVVDWEEANRRYQMGRGRR